jgi:hypothetical protein
MDWLLNNWLFLTVVFTLFCLNTVLQYRLGFKEGTTGGYSVGMLHAIKFLMKTEALEVENKTTGLPATAAEVVVFIMSKNYSVTEMTPIEAEQIARASIEKNKD